MVMTQPTENYQISSRQKMRTRTLICKKLQDLTAYKGQAKVDCSQPNIET